MLPYNIEQTHTLKERRMAKKSTTRKSKSAGTRKAKSRQAPARRKASAPSKKAAAAQPVMPSPSPALSGPQSKSNEGCLSRVFTAGLLVLVVAGVWLAV
jgi:hypothetical protein